MYKKIKYPFKVSTQEISGNIVNQFNVSKSSLLFLMHTKPGSKVSTEEVSGIIIVIIIHQSIQCFKKQCFVSQCIYIRDQLLVICLLSGNIFMECHFFLTIIPHFWSQQNKALNYFVNFFPFSHSSKHANIN